MALFGLLLMVSPHEVFGLQEADPAHSGSDSSTVGMTRNYGAVDPAAGESGFSHIEQIEEEPGEANEGVGHEGEKGLHTQAASDKGRLFERFVTYKACQAARNMRE